MADSQQEYEIQVLGRLEEPWLECFDRLAPRSCSERGGAITSSLVGPVIDQSELRGILESL